MKILILTALFPPLGYSGHDDRCRQVTYELARRGHRVQVLTSSHRVPAMGMPGESAIFRHLRLNSDNRSTQPPFNSILERERENAEILQQRIQRFSPDAIYIWNVSGLSNSLIFIAQDSGVPVIFDVHTPWLLPENFQNDPWSHWWTVRGDLFTKLKRLRLFLTGRAWSLKRKMPVETVDAIDLKRSFVCSQSLKDRVVSAGLKDFKQAEVMHPAINNKDIVRKTDYSHRQKFMWAGRLVEKKGPDIALDAVRSLKARGIEISLDIFGMGEPAERKAMRAEIEKYGLGEQVNMIGIAAGEIQAHYQNYDALLFTSRCNDPMPITPIEAMHAGLPTLLAKDGGIQEMTTPEETALMFESDNAESLADCIVRFLEIPDGGQAIAERCIKSLQHEQSFAVYVDRLEQLINPS